LFCRNNTLFVVFNSVDYIVIGHTTFDDVIVLAKDSTRTGRLAWYGSIEDARTFFKR
jgi:hypothetical protein